MPDYTRRPPLTHYRTPLPGVDYSELQGKLIVVEGPDAVGRSRFRGPRIERAWLGPSADNVQAIARQIAKERLGHLGAARIAGAETTLLS